MFFLIRGIFLYLGANVGKCVSGIYNVFLVGGKKLFSDRENQLFWELYGPLPFLLIENLNFQITSDLAL